MPPREKFRPFKESAELISHESLKAQFSKIISVHVDADNVDSFLEKALNQLILFTHTVTLAYQKESKSKDTSVTKAQEDAALAHYSLPAIEEYFEGIEKRQKIIAEAQALIDAVKVEEVVNTPPDRGGSIRTGNGHGIFENPATQKRLMLLLYLLKVDFDITLNQSDMQKGIVTRHMMRSESYVTVSISEKDRIVYICDEIGNATYVFDTEKLKGINLTIEQLNNLTKEEKNTLISENHGIGIRIVYSKFYRENITNLLEDTIPSPEAFKEAIRSKPELQKETSDAPKVITDELHPWRGFLERKNEEGVTEHWGAVKTIAKSLSIDNRKVAEAIDGLSPKEGKGVFGRKSNLYSLEQVHEKLKEYLSLPQVAQEGEWKGFFKQTHEKTHVTEHYAGIETLARELDLSPQKITASLGALSPLEGRDITGREASLYSLEQIRTKLKEYLSLPQVAQEGEWKGFLDQKDTEMGTTEHYGTVGTIARRLDIDHRKVIEAIDGLLLKRGRDVTGRSSNLYSLEQIQEKLKNFLNLPKVATEGERKGFFKQTHEKTHVTEHYADIETIAQSLDLSWGKIQSSVDGVSSIKGRNTIGKETNLYSLEQIRTKLKEYLSLPQVAQEGEWKGFLERINDIGVIEHYGVIETITQRLDVGKAKINSIVKVLVSVKGKDMSGNKANLYSLEQVIKKLEDEKNK